jgi:hypothetical protein
MSKQLVYIATTGLQSVKVFFFSQISLLQLLCSVLPLSLPSVKWTYVLGNLFKREPD